MLNGYRSTFSKTVTALMVLNHILGLNTYISGYVSNNRMSYQRFPPLWSKREKSPDLTNMSNPDPVFIPRQRLMLLTLQNRNVCI
jgi:hypothetical protein